ncbi:MAG: glycosyltransferase family 39 protein [Abitibacteriaceae bacterium]|nr:glycosyltransferase family 39 protein [Abditibacteriaceae bacterium]
MSSLSVGQRNEQRGFLLRPDSSQERTANPTAVWYYLAVTVSCLVMFFYDLGALPITTPNEGLYSQVAREMIERHDWVVPHINGLLYFEKPPLLYWLTALSMRLLGFTPFAARLPSALAGILSVWIVFWLGTRQWNAVVGACSAIVVATSIGFSLMARQVMFDALLTAWMSTSLVCFWLGSAPLNTDNSPANEAVQGQQQTERNYLIYGAYAATALAVLSKGFIAILLPLLILLSYAALTGDWPRLRPLRNFGGLLLFLLIAFPWHVIIAMRHHEWVWFYLINEHVLRFIGQRQPKDYSTGKFYTPLVGTIALIAPWCIFLPGALAYAVSQVSHTSQRLTQHWSGWHFSLAGSGSQSLEEGYKRDIIFILCWAAIPFLFFTVSHTRTFYYLLPLVPPLGLLIGSFWAGSLEGWNEVQRRRWLQVPLQIFLLIFLCGWLWCGSQSTASGLKGGRFAITFFSGFWLLLGMGAAMLAIHRARLWTASACIATAAMLTAMTGTTLVSRASKKWSITSCEEPLAAAIASSPRPPQTVVAMEGSLECHSSFVFYLPHQLRPVHIVDGQFGGDLEFGSHFPQARGLFLSHQELNTLAAQHPLFYLTDDPPKFAPPASLHPFRREDKLILWTNLKLK